MKRLLFALMFLGFAHAASAQTVTYTQGDVTSTLHAQGFTYRLYVTPSGSQTPNAPIVLLNVVCTGAPPSVTCTAPLPAGAGAALVTGAKSTLTAQDTATGTGESAPSLPFSAAAGVPTTLRIARP